jgi:hypothetical protein
MIPSLLDYTRPGIRLPLELWGHEKKTKSLMTKACIISNDSDDVIGTSFHAKAPPVCPKV